jgi:EKC/KEOPS complex subunit PCC1/LAGE3
MAKESATQDAPSFPCTLCVPRSFSRRTARLTPTTLNIPFPSARLAHTASQALAVDAELSPLVRRSFSTVSAPESAEQAILRVDYSATTNRMLRVAVNGFFESLGVVLGVMEELDVDVVHGEVQGELTGVQGLEVSG